MIIVRYLSILKIVIYSKMYIIKIYNNIIFIQGIILCMMYLLPFY